MTFSIAYVFRLCCPMLVLAFIWQHIIKYQYGNVDINLGAAAMNAWPNKRSSVAPSVAATAGGGWSITGFLSARKLGETGAFC